MSGARYSHHLHAEEAAGSLEALIRDYESRGRRLRACQQALLQAMDQHPDLAVFFEEALVASGEEVLTEAEQLHETGPSLWAAQPLLLSWALIYAAYMGVAAWARHSTGRQPAGRPVGCRARALGAWRLRAARRAARARRVVRHACCLPRARPATALPLRVRPVARRPAATRRA